MKHIQHIAGNIAEFGNAPREHLYMISKFQQWYDYNTHRKIEVTVMTFSGITFPLRIRLVSFSRLL